MASASSMANNRPMILGSLITNLAIHEKLIDPTRTGLHVACEVFPLDLVCLDRMGLLGKEEFISLQERYKVQSKDVS